MIEQSIQQSSFRDPAGYLFQFEGELYRKINPPYMPHYQQLMTSGLYQRLTEAGLLIAHEETSRETAEGLVIKPQRIPFISYPYEWSFSALQAAALTTLKIQSIALEHKMFLKDASAFNIQFYQGKPILIDTLSFEIYQEGQPWIAYKQFCQHFLAPLLLAKHNDIRLLQLSRNFIDGIPLDLTSKLLPRRSYLNLSCLFNIHLHAKMQKKYQNKQDIPRSNKHMSLMMMKQFIRSLTNYVSNLRWPIATQSEWFDYYQSNNNYTTTSTQQKIAMIDVWTQKIKPHIVWDLGSNTGRFSEVAARHADQVIAWDIDTSCVESLYLSPHKSAKILPLFLDLTNPSPSIGWAHEERDSLQMRGPANLVLALGLIHHLAIVNNVPLTKIATYFAKLCDYLIIEFIPKSDSQVQKLLSTREDIFHDYHVDAFVGAFKTQFEIQESISIDQSQRSLFLMKKLHHT